MNRRDFEKFLNNQLKGMPLEKVELELEKIQQKWIPEILEKKKKGKQKCNACGKYSPVKEFKIENEIKIITETTYTDCGYGDFDRIGEVERLYVYEICPLCGNKKEKDSTRLRIIREWDRCGYKL